MDINIIVPRRYRHLARAAELLGLDAEVSSTKADVVVREAYIAELLAAIAKQLKDLTTRVSSQATSTNAALTALRDDLEWDRNECNFRGSGLLIP